MVFGIATVTDSYLNRERACFSAAIRPDSAVFVGQITQQAMAVVPDAGRGRRRGEA
jgi:hypothetical protein